MGVDLTKAEVSMLLRAIGALSNQDADTLTPEDATTLDSVWDKLVSAAPGP